MSTHFKPIRYRRNPPPVLTVPGRRVQGPKTQDDQSGFPCYEGDIVVDNFGVRVDARDSTFDYDHSEGERQP